MCNKPKYENLDSWAQKKLKAVVAAQKSGDLDLACKLLDEAMAELNNATEVKK